MHRGPKGGANLEASFDALRFGLPRPPVLAHRLDKDTSGCLVLGRHRKATASLGLLFKHGKIGKTYWAVVEGGPAEDEGTIDMPLGRLNVERGWWQKPDPDGQKAVTNWKVRGRGDGLAWLALEPVTGRTHQLRVHTSATGWPIVGDNIYGNGPRFGEPTPASAFPRDRDSDFEEQGTGARGGAGAGAYAGAAAGRAGGTGSDVILSPQPPLCIIRESGVIQYSREVCDRSETARGVLGRPVKPGDDSEGHTVSRAPSCPAIVSARTAPGVSPAIATGRKCSVRPCLPLSISTCRVAPISAASRFRSAASPVARNRFARSLIASPATCGIRAAGVPGRGE